MTPITGSIVALATPMHEDGSVDYPALRKLIDWHIAEGTDCICVVGTMVPTTQMQSVPSAMCQSMSLRSAG